MAPPLLEQKKKEPFFLRGQHEGFLSKKNSLEVACRARRIGRIGRRSPGPLRRRRRRSPHDIYHPQCLIPSSVGSATAAASAACVRINVPAYKEQKRKKFRTWMYGPIELTCMYIYLRGVGDITIEMDRVPCLLRLLSPGRQAGRWAGAVALTNDFDVDSRIALG